MINKYPVRGRFILIWYWSELLIQFYTAVIESVLCSSITVWFGSATKLDRNRLQRTVRSAERIIGADLPTIQDLYNIRARKRAGKIIADPSHPGHNLFQLLPSGRRYRSLHTKTTWHRNSFFPLAVTLMNSWQIITVHEMPCIVIPSFLILLLLCTDFCT